MSEVYNKTTKTNLSDKKTFDKDGYTNIPNISNAIKGKDGLKALALYHYLLARPKHRSKQNITNFTGFTASKIRHAMAVITGELGLLTIQPIYNNTHRNNGQKWYVEEKPVETYTPTLNYPLLSKLEPEIAGLFTYLSLQSDAYVKSLTVEGLAYILGIQRKALSKYLKVLKEEKLIIYSTSRKYAVVRPDMKSSIRAALIDKVGQNKPLCPVEFDYDITDSLSGEVYTLVCSGSIYINRLNDNRYCVIGVPVRVRNGVGDIDDDELDAGTVPEWIAEPGNHSYNRLATNDEWEYMEEDAIGYVEHLNHKQLADSNNINRTVLRHINLMGEFPMSEYVNEIDFSKYIKLKSNRYEG